MNTMKNDRCRGLQQKHGKQNLVFLIIYYLQSRYSLSPHLDGLNYFHVEFEQHHRLTDSDLEKDMKSTAKIMLPNLCLASIVFWHIKANTNSFLYFLNKNNLNYITKNSLHTVKYGLEAKHS